MTGTTIVAATAAGAAHAAHLAEVLPGAHVDSRRPAREAVADALARGDALVCVMAVGACVRLIAAHLGDKHHDPPVVAVDDAAAHAVCVVGAHHGGDDLTRRVAAALGATPVVTTSSEVLGLPALDHLGAGGGLRLDSDIADVAQVGAALVAAHCGDGAPVTRWREQPWPTAPLAGVADADAPAAPGIAVTDRLIALPRPQVCYRPPSLVVGVGASRGADADEIEAAVDAAVAEGGLSPLSVTALATVEAKADEPGLVAVAERRGLPVVTHAAGTLAGVTVPNPSEAADRAVGTPSVAEAAALATAGDGDATRSELVVAKTRSQAVAAHKASVTPAPAATAPAPMATVAVARRPARGQLLLVSTGPGDERLLPEAARAALESAEVVIGLDRYVEQVRGWVRPGTDVRASPIGWETDRAADAAATARTGRRVALISGGDVGVYAMGSPALEALADGVAARADREPVAEVDVEVVPGVTAASAAAAVLGSPLGHDHCAISLSDLLTPWEVIRRRVKAAAEGDFVVVFYNPRSRGRRWQLDEALALLGEHRPPDTPVGLVTDASRPTERAHVTTLAAVDPEQVDMLTTVIVGSTQTRAHGSRMVTPRGYA